MMIRKLPIRLNSPANHEQSVSVFRSSIYSKYLRILKVFYIMLGWPGGAMVLGKLPVPGCPTYL